MLILAIDVGTHAVRAAIVDSACGSVQLSHSLPVGLKRLDARHIEQDPREILTAAQTVLQQVLSQAEDTDLMPVKAALATQRSTVLAWDRHSGAPLSAALSWQDTRAHEQVHQLHPYSADIKRRSGLVLSPHYGASKLHWLLETLGSNWQADDVCLSPLVSFLLFNLLRDHPCVCDESNAGRTQLLNLHDRAWDNQLCELFAVPSDFLPSLRPVQSDYGQLLIGNLPLTAVCGDQNAAFFAFAHGSGGGRALVNAGSGAFVLSAHNGGVPAAGELLVGVYRSDYDSVDFVIEGTVNGAGTALDWCFEQRAENDNLSLAEFYRLLPQWLLQVSHPPLFLNSIGGLGSPWWKPGAPPVFVAADSRKPLGLPEQACAVVESIVFLLCANIRLMQQYQPDLHELVVTGGIARLDNFCQKLANLSRLVAVRPAEMEATVVGAAALATGVVSRAQMTETRFEPEADELLQQRFDQFLVRISA